MQQDRFDTVSAALVLEAQSIMTAKRPGYTLGDVDVLRNFKQTAERAGITPGQAWAVFFLKHIDAITSVMTRPDLPMAEPPLGRFSDAINYLKLGWALYAETQGAEADERPASL